MSDKLCSLLPNPTNGSLEIVQIQPKWTVARKGIEFHKRQFVDCSSPTLSQRVRLWEVSSLGLL
jgi:hypothetical protein